MRATYERLDLLARLVRAEVLTTHRVDSCIASTRAFIDAAAALGWKAKPLPVVLEAYNAVLIAKLATHEATSGATEPSQALLASWAADGGYVVVVGAATTANDGAGHVVAVVENRFFVDPSVDQASRPAKEILLTEPVVTPYGGEEAFRLTRKDGVVLRYLRFPENERYLTSPDWTKRYRTAESVERAVAAYRAATRAAVE
jgi:hypothetical protein